VIEISQNKKIVHEVSNMKLLTANEWAGVAFAIALIVHCCQGYNMFQKIL